MTTPAVPLASVVKVPPFGRIYYALRSVYQFVCPSVSRWLVSRKQKFVNNSKLMKKFPVIYVHVTRDMIFRLL